MAGDSKVLDAYRLFDMPASTYLKRRVLPAIFLGIIAALTGVMVVDGQILSLALILSGFFLVLVIVYYPLLQLKERTDEIEQNFHILITHLTILSLTNTNRVEMFRIIAREESYGAIASEMRHFVSMIDTFNLSLGDAARKRANQTHSEILTDFYEKMAYNIGGGQDITSFLLDEQKDKLEAFSTNYKSSLEDVETISELFTTIALSSTFVIVFSMFAPLIIGMNATLLVGVTGFGYVVLQPFFTLLLATVSPDDPLWYIPENTFSPVKRNILIITILSLSFSIVLAWFVYVFHTKIPYQFWPVIPAIPLSVPGIYVAKKEREIKRVEEQFSGFIRSLGSIEAVKQTSTKNVLYSLKQKDFGTLSEHIEDLYRRLNLQIDTRQAWEHFEVNISSNLVKVFSDMYVLGRDLGGDTDTISDVLSDNIRRLIDLRSQRDTTKMKLVGRTYGITIISGATMFLGISIIKKVLVVAEGINTPGRFQILNSSVYSIPEIKMVVVAVIIVNSLLVGLNIRIIGRRIYTGILLHFSIVTVLTFTVGYGVETLASSLL